MSRKRTRPILVCSFCRQRKVKCDKRHPCSNCVKYGNPKCDYDYEISNVEIQLERLRMSNKIIDYYDGDSQVGAEVGYVSAANRERKPSEPFEESIRRFDNRSTIQLRSSRESKSKALIQEIDKVCSRTIDPLLMESLNQRKQFLQILNKSTGPEASSLHDDQEVNLHAYQKGFEDSNAYLSQYYGPLSYATMLNLDPELRMLKKHTQNKTEERQRLASLPPIIYTNEIEYVFFGVDRINMTCEASRYQKRSLSNPSQFAQTPIFTKVDSADSLIENICSILPPVDTIWEYVAVFFKYVYPFIPLLDEEEFKNDIQRILPKELPKGGIPASINISNKLDYIRLGLLLVIIRISNLILPGTVDAVDIYHEQDLPALPQISKPFEIKQDVIRFAQICLSQLDVNYLKHILILQLTIFLRFYVLHGPELGPGSNQSDTQNSLPHLIQMARSLGLHRDADSSRRALLGKKIWHFLMKWNRSVYTVYGDAILFHGSSGITITVAPSLKGAVSSMEQFVVDTENKLNSETEAIVELLHLTSKPGRKTSTNEIEYLMDLALSDCIVDIVPEEDDEEAMLKNVIVIVKQFNKFLISHYLMMILLHWLYNHFIQICDAPKASVYLAKQIELVHGKFMPILVSVLGYTSQAKYKRLVGLMSSPVLFLAVQKAFVLNASLTLKSRLVSESVKGSSADFGFNLSLFEEAISRSNSLVSSCFSYFSRLTGRLNHGWRYTKLIETLTESLDQVQPMADDAANNYGFTETNVVTLRNIIEESLKAEAQKNKFDTGNHVLVSFQDQSGATVSQHLDDMVPRSSRVHENFNVVIDEESYVASAPQDAEADTTVSSSDMSFLFNDMDDIFRNYLQ